MVIVVAVVVPWETLRSALLESGGVNRGERLPEAERDGLVRIGVAVPMGEETKFLLGFGQA